MAVAVKDNKVDKECNNKTEKMVENLTKFKNIKNLQRPEV